MDVIDSVLSSMRLSGGVFLDAEFRGDWSILASFSPTACSQFFPVRGSLISYHFVREGELVAEVEGDPPQPAGPGTILLLPRNHDHHLYNSDVPTLDAGDYVMPPCDDGPATLRLGSGDKLVKLYCGFLSASSAQNPILDQLPSLLVLKPNDSRGAWVDASMRFVADQAGKADPAIVGRLAELMFAEAVKLYLESDDQARRLVAGLNDPCVARALDVIHTRYADDLSVDEIAREAGMSKTVLGERFTSLLGEPPIRYCARWRMRKAANMIEQGATAADAAFSVGFGSEAAFTRAFKREYGAPPATWRRNQRALA